MLAEADIRSSKLAAAVPTVSERLLIWCSFRRLRSTSRGRAPFAYRRGPLVGWPGAECDKPTSAKVRRRAHRINANDFLCGTSLQDSGQRNVTQREKRSGIIPPLLEHVYLHILEPPAESHC